MRRSFCSCAGVEEVPLFLVDVEQFLPLLPLGVVGGDLGVEASAMLPTVMQYCVSVMNFRFSKSIFWKSSIWARKSMIRPPMALMTRMIWNQPSARASPAASISSRFSTSFFR